MSNENHTDANQTAKTWLIIAGIIGAIIIAGTASAIYWFVFRTPSFQTPAEAITTCLSQLNQQFSTEELGLTSLEEKLDRQAMLKAMAESGRQADYSLTLNSSDFSELAMLEGLTANFSYLTDAKNKQAFAGISAYMYGFGGDVGFYFNKDKLALTSDEFLPDAYLSLKKSSLTDYLEKSTDGKLKDYLLSLLEQQSATTENGIQNFLEYALKQLPDSLVNFVKDWEIKETNTDGKTGSLNIANQNYDCYSYEVSISGKNFQDFIEDYCTYLSKYDFENNTFFSFLEEIQQRTLSGLSSLEWENIIKDLPKQIHASDEGKLLLTLHITPKGKLLGVDMTYAEKNDHISMELRFGGKSPGQNIYMKATVQNTLNTFLFDLSSTRTSKDKTETAETVFTMDINGEILNYMTKNDYNTKEDSFNRTLHLSGIINGESADAKLTVQGSYPDIKKGESYTAKVDNCSISVESENFTHSLDFSGKIHLGVLQKTIPKPSGTEYDLLNLSDKDKEGILKTLNKNQLLSIILRRINVEDLQKNLENTFQKVMQK